MMKMVTNGLIGGMVIGKIQPLMNHLAIVAVRKIIGVAS